MIEQKSEDLKVPELMGDFQQKIIDAVEKETIAGGKQSGKTIKLEELKAKLEVLQQNPTTPEVRPTVWENKQTGYIMNGNIATFIKSKTQYSVDSNGVWRRISQKRHE